MVMQERIFARESRALQQILRGDGQKNRHPDDDEQPQGVFEVVACLQWMKTIVGYEDVLVQHVDRITDEPEEGQQA